jgi:hypothetical protein
MRLALLLLLAARIASADDLVTETGSIEGVAVDPVFQPIGGATVRIVGDAVVMTLRADAGGRIRTTGLPPGRYRIEVERGQFSARAGIPGPDVSDRPATAVRWNRERCCICAMQDNARILARQAAAAEAAHRRRVIDTRSTTLGVRLTRRDILGY